MRFAYFILCFLPGLAVAGQAVSPDTPNDPPAPPKPVVERPSTKTPPDCVRQLLEAIYEREKAHFAATKTYSESLWDIHALSVVGVGCPGWDLPVIKSTYGNAGFNAVMVETATAMKWTINQDKTLFAEEKIIRANTPAPATAP